MFSILKKIDLTTPLAAIVVTIGALLAYRPILQPPAPALDYPWSSDTWGHLIKVLYLDQQVAKGIYYPDIFPGWYNGVQLLRYYAPAPYYLMLAIYRLSHDIFLTSTLFLFLAAWVTAISMLLFRPQIGLVGSTLAGLFSLLVPDSVRVAFAEGNVPRVMALAVLPYIIYSMINLLEGKSARRHFVGLTLGMALVVLCHAMMAAIFAVCMGLFALIYWQLARGDHRRVGAGLAACFAGLLLSGWWLFPSLTGGITEIDQTAASEAIAYFPLDVAFNPSLRFVDPEQFYVGLSFAVATLVAILVWRRISPFVQTLFVVGMIASLVSSSFMDGIYSALPMHQLFWPIRFESYGGIALVLASMGLAAQLLRSGGWWRIGFVGVILVVGADLRGSTTLIHLREAPGDVVSISEQLKTLPGWRVAAADLSELGSAPSYYFTALANREQIFGWAYQGSTTAPIVASINYAMGHDYAGFAVDRLRMLGTDDVVTLNALTMLDSFRNTLVQSGFKLVSRQDRADLYHIDGGPRGLVMTPDTLAIGDGAANLAYMFPEVTVGSTNFVDDYDMAFLSRFRVIVLSRFTYHRRTDAENLVTAYAQHGGKVIVDLTDAPVDVFAREPRFLGVYAEPIYGLYQTALHTNGQTIALKAFPTEYTPWITFTPQGLDSTTATFDYLGLQAAAIGTKNVGNASVTFVGMNLIFQAMTTHDAATTNVLGNMLGLEPGMVTAMPAMSLENYSAGSDGYRFSYTLDRPGLVLFPFASHDGTYAVVDGQKVQSWSLSRLVTIDAPSGHHEVFITTAQTRIYLIGRVATAVGLIIVIAYLILAPRIEGRRPSEPEPEPVKKREPLPWLRHHGPARTPAVVRASQTNPSPGDAG